MTKIAKDSKARRNKYGRKDSLSEIVANKGRGKTMLTIAAGMAFALLMFIFMKDDQSVSNMEGYLLRATSSIDTSSISSSSSSGGADVEENRRAMMDWRKSVRKECRQLMESVGKKVDSSALDKKEQLEKSAMSKISLISNPSGTVSGTMKNPYRRCRNAFIDLGTNIGDSVGYFVDNAMDVCSSMWAQEYTRTKFDKDFPRPHIDVASLELKSRGTPPNPLYGTLQRIAQDSPNGVLDSESFCAYGMEGNPEFTERLTKLENFVNGMNPRPVEHLHIFTESVVTAKDGPTKLYLDKTSVKENFWGSSILSSQQDAVKSAKKLGDGNLFSADVQGIALSTMVKNTLLATKEGATPDEKKGGTLIVKMDVEGAEYQVIKEVAETGLLCALVENGNKVILVVETHNMSITDPAERAREKAGYSTAKKKLETCGVKFQKLHAFWH